MHLCAPSHLILTVTHYMGTVLFMLHCYYYYIYTITLFYFPDFTDRETEAMVTALVSGTLGPDPAG